MRPGEFFNEVRENFSDILYCGLIVDDEISFVEKEDSIDQDVYESIVMRLYFLATDPQKHIDYFITQYQEGQYLYIKKIEEGLWLFMFSNNKSFAKLHFFVQFILSEDRFELDAAEHDTFTAIVDQKLLSAKRIQDLMMPDLKKSLAPFSHYHSWYQPEDLVGGDFYWIRQTRKHTWIVIGDCTGHSVEGALASVSVMSILNQVFDPEGTPHMLIKQLHTSLDDLQEQKIAEGYGIGCEMIVMRFDLKGNELVYSGTGLPLYHFKNRKPTFIKTRKAVLNPEHVIKYLRSRRIQFSKGDAFFTHSDGLLDQINAKGKRIQKREFKALLQSTGEVNDEVTKSLIKNHLSGYPMIDDIVSMYLKI